VVVHTKYDSGEEHFVPYGGTAEKLEEAKKRLN
jgi:hypothetical protein